MVPKSQQSVCIVLDRHTAFSFGTGDGLTGLLSPVWRAASAPLSCFALHWHRKANSPSVLLVYCFRPPYCIFIWNRRWLGEFAVASLACCRRPSELLLVTLAPNSYQSVFIVLDRHTAFSFRTGGGLTTLLSPVWRAVSAPLSCCSLTGSGLKALLASHTISRAPALPSPLGRHYWQIIAAAATVPSNAATATTPKNSPA
jgi:hypothetical protein